MANPTATTGARNHADRRELEAIARLCGGREPRAEFLRTLSARLCRHVGADSFCFSLLDPITGLPVEVISQFDDEPRQAWLDSIFLRTPLGDMGWLTRQPQRVQWAAQFVPRPERDPLFAKLLLPCEMKAMVCVSMTDAGFGWGYLNLMRRTGAPEFGAGEKRFLAGTAPIVVAELRRRASLQWLTTLPGSEVGLVTLDPSGEVDAVNDVGQTMLAKHEGSSFPFAVALMGQLLRRTILEGKPAPTGVMPIVDASTGRRYQVRPQLLTTREGRLRGAVIVEPLRSLTETGTLLQLGLTPRETDVATMTMRGLSTQDAGKALGVSPHTVEHHLGNVFVKLSVGSRAEMAALLLGS